MRKTTKTLTATPVLLLALLTALPVSAEILEDFPEVVLFATNSMEIESSAQVFTGDVVVNEAVAGTLSFGNKAKTPAGWEVKANTIDVGNFVTLAGMESCNFGDISPCDFSLGTPVYGLLPLFQASTPGGVNVNVPNSGSATVSGDALDITIGLEGTVTFTPGVHSVRSITASKKADLVFTGPTEIRVEQGISMGVEANINLSGAPASQVILYVGGDTTLGPKSTVNANIYLGTGTLVISGNVIATGAFLAEDLIVETKAKIHLATFWDTPPVANDDSYSTDEDTQLVVNTVGPLGNGVLVNDTDAENDLLTAVLVTDVSNGTLTLNSNGSFTYDPNDDYYGLDSFVYMACDELPYNVDNCENALVSITVDPINDVPSFTAGADPVVSNEDAGGQSVAWATDILAGAGDETDQAVSFNVSNDNNGLFSLQPSISANGTLTYTSAPDANGSATVTVSLSDNCPAGPFSCGVSGQLTSADQMFTITVNAVNDEPSFDKGADEAVAEDAGPQSVTGWATGISPGPADESGQTVSFIVTNDNNGLFSAQPAVANDGTLTYTPANDAFGSANVSVSAMDDGGTANGGDDTSGAQVFTITVNSVNDPPVPGPDSASTAEETLVTIDVLPNDTGGPLNENQTRTLDDVGQAASGTTAINISDPSKVDYTPNSDFFGEDTFGYTVCDGGDDDNTATDGDDLCATGSVTVTVSNVNDAPTADPQDLFATELVTITLTGNDPDGDSLTFTEVTAPTKGTLSTITPIVPSGGGAVISATVTYSPDLQLCSGDPLECPEDFFTFQVSDGSLTDTADVTLNPGGDPTVDPPSVTNIDAKDQPVETNTGVPVEIILVAAAESGIDDLVFTIDSGPTPDGSLSAVVAIDPVISPIRSAKTTYTPTCTPMLPAASPTCTASFVFKACEVALLTNCDTATVEINVTPDNAPAAEPPVAEDMSLATPAGKALVFDLLATAGTPGDRTCTENSECGAGFVCNGQGICEPEGPLGPTAGSAATSVESWTGGVNGASSGTSSSAGPVLSAGPVPSGGQPEMLAPITPDSGWTASPNFTWSGTPITTPPCVPVGTLCPLAAPVFSANTFEFAGDTCVTIVDDFFRGDRFAVYDNGQIVGATPVVAVATEPDSGVGPDAALADPTRSSGTFDLGPGSHMLTIEVLLPSFQSGGDFLRVDSSTSSFCDPSGVEGGTPLLTYTITNVPDPSFGTLTDSAGTVITEGAVLTNPEVTFTPVAETGTSSFTFTAFNHETQKVSNLATVDLSIFEGGVVDLCAEVGRPAGCSPGAAPAGGASTVGGLPSGSAFTVEVSGSGNVTSTRPVVDRQSYLGLVCSGGSACSANFVEGSTVALYARPVGNDSEFVEWGGDCYGSDPVALVRAGSETFCTATFRKTSD